MDDSGIFNVLVSDINLYFTGGSVNDYYIAILGSGAIPGLYPTSDKGWVAGIILSF
jgi:hypothetical protein